MKTLTRIDFSIKEYFRTYLLITIVGLISANTDLAYVYAKSIMSQTNPKIYIEKQSNPVLNKV